MRVTKHIEKANETLLSFEIIPPRRGGDINALLSVLEDLVKFNPPYIDITSHAAEVLYEETANGEFKVKVKRKRPNRKVHYPHIRYLSIWENIPVNYMVR